MKYFVILAYLLFNSVSFAQSLLDLEAEVLISDDVKTRIGAREQLVLELGIIPGSIFGPPALAPKRFIEIPASQSISVPLSEFKNTISNYIKVLTDAPINSELIVIPSEVRFARVSTLSVNTNTNKYENSGVINANGDFLILAYFDRPAAVNGKTYIGTKPVNHNIQIAAEGFHWLEYINGTNSDTITNINSSVNAQFVIGTN